MRFRIATAILLGVGITLSTLASAQAGPLMALHEKHKNKPDGVHAKVHAKKTDFKMAHPGPKARRS